MQQRRLFANQNNTAKAKNAFVTGIYTPEVIELLKKYNAAIIVKMLPENINTVILSPEILALSEAKLCGIFNAMPAHIKTVIFNFTDLQHSQLNAASELLAHTPYAKQVEHYRLAAPTDDSMTERLALVFRDFHRGAKIERIDSQAPSCG